MIKVFSMAKLVIFSFILVLCLETFVIVSSADTSAAAAKSNGTSSGSGIRSLRFNMTAFDVVTIDLTGENNRLNGL